MSEVTDDSVFGQQMPAPGRPKKQAQLSQQRHTETMTASEWAATLNNEGALQIKVTRTEPTHWPRGTLNKFHGYCTTYAEPVTEARLQAEWGGGTYMLQAIGSDGKPLIAPHYVVIAGDPIVPAAQLKKDDDVMNKTVFSTMEKMAERRVEDIRATSAASAVIVENTTRTLERQLDKADEEKQRLEARLLAMHQQLQEALQPRANPQQDKLVEMIAQNTMNQANMSTQRYESEIRQTKELASDNERRLQATFDRDKASIVESHQRELALVRNTLEQTNLFMKSSFEREIDNLKSNFEHRSLADKTTLKTELMLLKSKLEDTQNLCATKDAELNALRAKKDQTLQEKAAEIETFRSFFAKDDPEPASGINGVLGKMMDSPLIKTIAGKVLAGAMEAPQQVMQPQQLTVPAQTLPARLPPPQIRRVAPRSPVPPVPETGLPTIPVVAQVAEAPPPVPVTSGEVEAALTYCKAAFDSQQDPAEFANSVKDLIPANVLNEIRSKGADDFLKAHGKTDTFGSQQAKNWIRKVTQTLNR